VCAVTFALAVDIASAQHYSFRQYGEAQGLRNLAVRALLQDHLGFIWVGTENGLYRFDGERFVVYTTAQGLPSNFIQSLAESEDGTLWIGTSGGVITRRNGAWQPLQSVPPIVYGPESFASDGKGTVYIASGQGLLAASWGGNFWRLEPVLGVPQTLTKSVYFDAGTIWATSRNSLWRLQAGKLKQYSDAEGLPSTEGWGGILRNRQGDLYVRSNDDVRVLRKGAGKFELVKGLPTRNWSDQLSFDSSGNIVIPTDEGLLRTDGTVWASEKEGLPDDPICCMITDRDGSPWIGSASQGLLLWAGSRAWESYGEKDGLSNNMVSAIYRDGSGTLWVGTRYGLHRMRGSRFEVVSKADWTRQIRAIRSTPDGIIWIGTSSAGVTAFNPRSKAARSLGEDQGIMSPKIIGLDTAGGQLWIYTRRGVYAHPLTDAPRKRTGDSAKWHFTRWTALESFAPETVDKPVYRIQFDQEGRLWAATLAGLFVQENGSWKRFGKKDGLLEDAVAFLTIDHQDRVWIGYSDDVGVSRLRYTGGRLQINHFTHDNGLPTNVVNFLGLGQANDIWVGSDSGVNHFDAGRWRNYDNEDGLVWPDTWFNAFWADSDGIVWIGTTRGLSRFDVPNRPPVRAVAPPFALTEIEVNGKSMSSLEPSRSLPPGSTVKFGFAVLLFNQRQGLRYRYRLVGLDNRWIQVDQGPAVLPSLSPGHYRFEAEAYQPLRGWVTKPVAVSFDVKPFWWQEAWFRILTILALAAGIVGFWRWRIRVLLAQKNALAIAVGQRTAEIRDEKTTVERQKQQIEQLLAETQRTSKLKDEFLANISHEIRTPLHGVLGMTALALTTSLTDEQREYLELAERSARSLLRLLNDILDFSKIEAGKLALHITPFSLRECVESAAGTMAIVAKQKGLDFRVLLGDDLPETVIGDSDRLRQILTNLVSNAVKFTPAGRVHLTAYRAPSEERPDLIRFSVEDTGIGVPEEKRAIIFEPFRQADGSTTRKFGGTGLGLSICVRLIAQMKGELNLTSETGRGSTFSFTIPLPETPSALETWNGLNKSNSGATSMRVLLVEDNPISLKVGTRLLEREGCSVMVAPNGYEALAHISRSEFDLILMDLQMPGMDGIEATRELRRREEGKRRSTVVMLSGSATVEDRERAKAAGADAYLLKPVQMDELRRVLAEYSAIER
jgi:signal transduction histidine kinase/ligand-binding sensor domain-containing protein/ActR/RegA family two-component response regulator